MNILKLSNMTGEFFPEGIKRLDYKSGFDGFQDWALLLPGQNSEAPRGPDSKRSGRGIFAEPCEARSDPFRVRARRASERAKNAILSCHSSFGATEDPPCGSLLRRSSSGYEGREPQGLLAKKGHLWIIVIHGHGSTGDQLYTRGDLREKLLPVFLESGAGILTVNLRGNNWMGPAGAEDMHALTVFLRDEYGMQKSVFYSGSMGGTSNLIYGVLYPEDVSAIVALGAASDLATYYQWCRQQDNPILQEIAEAIKNSYGGAPHEIPDIYRRHSALHNAGKIKMPVFLSHGGADMTIPVEQSRTLAHKMKDNTNFCYREIPGGNHDSPLHEGENFNKVFQVI